MKKFILVTGGAGYIGSTVVNFLIDRGKKVIIVDNLSSGSLKLVNKKALFYKCDIKSYDNLFRKLKKYRNKISSVFHFAASLSVSESQKKPLKYYNNNVLGTENVLNISKFLDIKKFIFSSTCAVYGNLKKKKISEKTPTFPFSNYGKTKLFSELLIKEHSKINNFKYAILRYFNVVGAEYKYRSGPISGKTIFKVLASNLVKNFFKIDLYGDNYSTKDGSCIRDYIDVNDLAELHILSDSRLNKSNSFILNCGYGKGYSVKEVISAFSKFIKKNISINIKPRRSGDVESIYCNTKKLKKIFPKWTRKSTIAQSIFRSIKWENALNK